MFKLLGYPLATHTFAASKQPASPQGLINTNKDDSFNRSKEHHRTPEGAA